MYLFMYLGFVSVHYPDLQHLSVMLYGWQMVHQLSYEVIILYCCFLFFFLKRVKCVNVSRLLDDSSVHLCYAGDALSIESD